MLNEAKLTGFQLVIEVLKRQYLWLIFQLQDGIKVCPYGIDKGLKSLIS